MRLPAHEATTAQLGAAYPCVATRRLPARGVFIGRDLFGGSFVYDPFELYRAGAITNPNMVVLGQIGRGKSAFVKTYLLRQAAFGRRIVILDPKGEYGPFARALGAEPIVLRPGGSVRLNPLSVAERSTADESGDVSSRRSVVADLASACLGRSLGPAEHVAIDLALDSGAPRGQVADAVLGRHGAARTEQRVCPLDRLPRRRVGRRRTGGWSRAPPSRVG